MNAVLFAMNAETSISDVDLIVRMVVGDGKPTGRSRVRFEL